MAPTATARAAVALISSRRRPAEGCGSVLRPHERGDHEVENRCQRDNGDHQKGDPTQLGLEVGEMHHRQPMRCGQPERGGRDCGYTTRRATAVKRGRRPATTRPNDPDEAARCHHRDHLCGRLRDRSAADVEQHRVSEGARGGNRCRWPVAGKADVQQFTDRDQNDERDRDVRANHTMDAGRHRGGHRSTAHECDEDSPGDF